MKVEQQGVSIRIDDENLQIRTSKDGTFKLLLHNRKVKIKLTNVGYRNQEINYTAGDINVRGMSTMRSER